MVLQTRRSPVTTLALVSALSVGALASTSVAADADADEAKPLEEVVVTGSSLPTTPDAVAVPVTVLDADKLEKNGISSNALEALRKAVPSFAGRSNTGNSNANNNNQNTAGGSQVQLRNLPTLVLINGRRAANSAVGGFNGKNFVDVNQIPIAAVDHVEVLTDGASAIYGSDAIGGVVNFILKSDYEGLSSAVRYASADDYSEKSLAVTGGTRLGDVSITATGSYSKTDPLPQNARSFTSPLFSKSSNIPGVVLGGNALLAAGRNSPSETNPVGTAATAASAADLIANGTYAATTPAAISSGFDVSQFQTLLLEQEVASFAASLSAKMLDGDLEAFGDVLIARSKSFTQWLPVPFTGSSVPQNAPFNPVAGSFPGVIFDYLPNSKEISNESWARRAVAGLRGEFAGDWQWETGVTYSKTDLEQRQANVIYKPNMPLAIAGGFDATGNPVVGGGFSRVLGDYSLSGASIVQPALDPFARTGAVNPASLANLYGTEVLNADSELVSVDAKVVGEMFDLPAGSIGVALGANWRREKLEGHADANGRVTDPVTGSTTGNAQQWLGGTFIDPFSADRTIDAVFAEVRVPITSDEWNVPGLAAFDLIGAVRWEKYSDVGNSSVPKIGFRWQPFDRQLTVRGNYSESFSAPGLYAEYGPTATRQVGTGVLSGLYGPGFSLPFNGQDGNNPNLDPATSLSRSIGIVFEPQFLDGLSVSADYSSIDLRDYAGGLGFNNIIGSVNTLGSASPYFNNLSIDNFVGAAGATQPFTNPGDLLAFLTNPATGQGSPAQANRLYVIDQFQNLASLQERSYTLHVGYSHITDEMGTFSFDTYGAFIESFKFQALPGGSSIEYAGHSNNTGVFGGTLPKHRFYTTVGWNLRDWDVTLGNTYVASTTDTGANGTSTPQIAVDSYLTWDLRVAYDLHLNTASAHNALKLALGVNNLTDEMPPLAPRAFLDNNADVATFSPIGRLIYATVAYDF